MASLFVRPYRDTLKKVAELKTDSLETIADSILDLEDEMRAVEDRRDKLSDTLQALAMAVLEEHRIPVNRIKDEDYIYDEIGSQLGSATNKALSVLRGDD